jgi:hypothetical protein
LSADRAVDPTFKLVFSTVVGLTVLTKAAGTFSDLLKLLTGALAGLLGGKSLA